MLGGEVGNAGELQRLLVGEGVADLDRAVVVDADNVARESLFDIGPVLSHEDGGIGKVDLLADTVMSDLHAVV